MWIQDIRQSSSEKWTNIAMDIMHSDTSRRNKTNASHDAYTCYNIHTKHNGSSSEHSLHQARHNTRPKHRSSFQGPSGMSCNLSHYLNTNIHCHL